MRRSLPVFGCLCLFVLMACDKKRVFDDYQSLPGQWHKDSVVSFNFKTPDTVNTYNLFINLRNNSDYRYSNLFLITQMNFPNGKVISDTLEYEMAAPSGKWLGTGFGELKESKLWYKENILFAEAGVYRIDVRHAMRQNGEIEGVDALEGITEVGFRIEHTEN